MKSLIESLNQLCSKIPEDIIALVARIAVGLVFWRSAQTKIDGSTILGQKWQFFNVSDSTFTLFEYEYELPIIPSDIAAYLATYSEFFLGGAIILGLFTRLSAIALLGMTLVIQIFVYPDAWPTHIMWLVPLLYLIKHGGGKASVDSLIR
ncbi:DoxX family protein [Psychrobium sp. nBUS_13]|uniref:DoxX family protein n=1 Tax=Psychrobium sp. nBUS_13 TaxID=3395319 RepID=UPI003EC04516